MLLAEARHNLRRSFQVGVHVFFSQPPDHHAHPLQGRGEGELTHNTDLAGLRSKRHTTMFTLTCSGSKKGGKKEKSLKFWEIHLFDFLPNVKAIICNISALKSMQVNARHMFYILLSCVLLLSQMFKCREITNLFKVTVHFLLAIAS